MLILTLRQRTAIPLEMQGILPSVLAGKSNAELAKLPLRHGNRIEDAGDHFVIEGSADDLTLHIAGDTECLKSIGYGMETGAILVAGAAGIHAGAQMTGGSLVIAGDAGDWLGAEMRGGTIQVHGSVGSYAGGAYRGSRRGMTGGEMRIRGSAGDELGSTMRRGSILCGGSCGSFAGAGMIAGTIVVQGNLGPRAGSNMKRGTIITFDEPIQIPSGFRDCGVQNLVFLRLLQKDLGSRNLLNGQSTPWGECRVYKGDVLTGGNGELLIVGI